ncbi:Dkk2 [Columba guinea]|nr:Dkk2 [Columba guinea]
MIVLMWNKCSCCLLLLAAVLIVESSQLDSASSKVNSIKSTLMGEAPTQATNRSAGIHQGLTLASSKKGKMLVQMGKKPPKHYHRQGECCVLGCVSGTFKSKLASMILISMDVKGPYQSQEEQERNGSEMYYFNKQEACSVSTAWDRSWPSVQYRNRSDIIIYVAYPCTNDKECEVGRYCHSPHQAMSACMLCRRKKKRCHRDGMCCPGNRCNNGHEGDPCLRSSDCIEGHCCARHFWTKICKPVLHQGEVCTKQRKKGSHGLEIFQRCDCAKGLSCKVWKDATSSSKSRLHVCQKI